MTATAIFMLSDPITGRLICLDCWNQLHGTKDERVCKVFDCRCGCKDAQENQVRERAAHRAAQQERRRLEQEQLEAENNPLRACNPDYREPSRTNYTRRMQKSGS